MLENLDQNQVELVDVTLLLAQRRLIRTRLDDDPNDEVPDTRSLLLGEDLPSTLDQLVDDLKGDVLGLGVARLLENIWNFLPRVGVFLESSEDELSLRLLEEGVE